MTGLAARWRRFWLQPGSATDLAICRILICSYMLWLNLGADGSAVASYFRQEMWRPVSFFALLADYIPTPQELGAMANVWKLGLLFGALGLLTRTSLAVAFVFGVLSLGWGMNFGKVNHMQNVALLSIGVLALSRSGDVLSLDAWLRVRRGLQGSVVRAAPSSEYTWPIRVGWLLMTLMFFGAGVSKLRRGGLEWMTEDSFSTLLIPRQYHNRRILDWGIGVANTPGLPQLLATGTVVLELLAPLAMVSRFARLLVVPLLFSMQVGIAVLMHVHVVSPNFVCYAFFVPWTRLLDRGLLWLPGWKS